MALARTAKQENHQSPTLSGEFICRRPVQVIEFSPIRFKPEMHPSARLMAMLAEKFFLVLETLRSHASEDKPPQIVASTPRPVPVSLPRKK
jgi:hypothetical protein